MAKPPEADRHSSWSETQPCPELDCEKQQNDETTRSKYHKHAMALLLVYVPLITVPWALTCVMAKRPFTTSSFYVQTGLSARDITRINGWMTAINVINSIASVVTIPVISALVAQAAAVYAQKHRDSERFSLQHLTALADRGWLNPMTLTKSWTWRGQGLRGVRSFLYLATLVIFLGAIQQPLYQILAPVDTILVPTCHDARYMRLAAFNDSAKARCSWRKTPPAKLIGWDIEPAEMARVSHTDLFNRISSELAVVSLKDLKAHLWSNKTDPEANRQPMGALGLESFAASLEQGSSTGVLREHIMRFNSSVNCQRIDRAQFPLTCAGKRPFQVAYGHGSNFTRVCVPGEYGVSPWNLTRNRQDFFEELFFDVLEEVPPNYGALNTEFITSNYTLHCTSTTTRGYFELGNYRNNYTWGPLLTSWPSEETMRTQFNDVIDYTLSSQMRIPKETDALALDSTWWNPFDLAVSSTWTAPGPLTMSAFALFGNKTFLESGMRAWNTTLVPDDSARLPWQQICSSIPFTRMDPSDKFNPQAFPSCVQFAEQEMRYATLKKTLSKWLLGFNDTRRATRALATSVYLVNEAMLTMHHWHPEYSDNLDGHRSIYTRTGRQIYEGAGMRVHKPKVSVTGMAIMTTLLVLQLAGLGVLAWLIYQAPSETRSLDALYVFNLIRNMPHDEAGVDDRGGRESKDEGTQLLGLTGKQGAMMRSQIRVL